MLKKSQGGVSHHQIPVYRTAFAQWIVGTGLWTVRQYAYRYGDFGRTVEDAGPYIQTAAHWAAVFCLNYEYS